MYLGISLELLRAVWGQFSFRQFLVPAYTSSQGLQVPSNVANANYRFLICCTCHFQSSSLFFVYFCFLLQALQYLTSALTQGGECGHLFRLTCSIVLRGGRNIANKYHWHVWGVLAVSGPHWVCPCSVCVLSWSTLLRLQVALQGNCLRWALGCTHFPGLSRSGSVSWVLHKGTDLVWPAFCALPRSEQLRHPGAWRAHTTHVGSASYHLLCPSRLVSCV